MFAAAIILLAAIGASAHPTAQPEGRWWQDDSSAVTAMFRRAAPDPSDPNFANNYPSPGTTPADSQLPQAWKDKLASVTLPSDVPVSNPNNGLPTYSNGKAGNDPTICSFTYECTTSDDLYNPPDGVLALTFDDGPGESSTKLYDFLKQNNASSKATHFMIGGNIVGSPTVMQRAASDGGLIAVHTWSHPYMTSMSNEAVLSELGWTMQIISDLNGGRVPKYWRPPYGDVDNRVRAIAKGVFGLETVPWNQDSADWAIGNNPQYTHDSQVAQVKGWLAGSKSPGLCILEHEIHDTEVDVFTEVYPFMVSNGWNILNVADAWKMPWYQNSGDNSNSGAVTSMAIVGGGLAVSSNATSSTSTMSNATSTTMASTTAMSTTSVQSTTSASTTASTTGTSVNAAASTTKSGAGSVVASLPSGGLAAVVIGGLLAMLL